MNQKLILSILCTLMTVLGEAASSANFSQPETSPLELFGDIALQQAPKNALKEAEVREAVLSDEQNIDAVDDILPHQSLSEIEISITEDTTDDLIIGSPTGNYKVSGYACNVVNTPDENRIWAIHLYDFGTSLTDSEVVFGLSKNRKIQSVACTPDGSFLLFSVKETTIGDYEIYGMDLSTRELTQLTDNDTDDVDVTLSADGLKMAWQERLADGRQAIAIRTYHEDKRDFSQVSLASANPFIQPSLSANGKWLALVQMRKNNFLGLRYDTEAELFFEVKSIPRRVTLSHPSISDEGVGYGWLQGKKNAQYIYKDLTTSVEEKILDNPEGIQHPLISPDGKWVFYSYNNTQLKSTRLAHLSSGQTATISSNNVQSIRYMGNYWMGNVERKSPILPVTGRLNDTGFTQCADIYNIDLSCPVEGLSGQDAESGRDFYANDDSDGHAGFSLIKLNENGNELLANATEWTCVKDNVTGLVWEVKKGGNGIMGDEGLHDADDVYQWYSTDITNYGGHTGYKNMNGSTCHEYDAANDLNYCNTQAYTSRVNEKSLCGSSDWRLPSRSELRTLLRLDSSPHINKEYFPNTKNRYWTSSPYARYANYAWYVDFSAYDIAIPKNSNSHIRLVRGGK